MRKREDHGACHVRHGLPRAAVVAATYVIAASTLHGCGSPGENFSRTLGKPKSKNCPLSDVYAHMVFNGEEGLSREVLQRKGMELCILRSGAISGEFGGVCDPDIVINVLPDDELIEHELFPADTSLVVKCPGSFHGKKDTSSEAFMKVKCLEGQLKFDNKYNDTLDCRFVVQLPDESVEEMCRRRCKEKQFCCNDFRYSANHLISCAQACMIRVRGMSVEECQNACPPSGEVGSVDLCKQRIGGHWYSVCDFCEDQEDNTNNQKCLNQVPDKSACHAGCYMDPPFKRPPKPKVSAEAEPEPGWALSGEPPEQEPTPAPTPQVATTGTPPTPVPNSDAHATGIGAPYAYQCQHAYGQCGGRGFHGPTTCCAGNTCYFSDQFYSQCKPEGTSHDGHFPEVNPSQPTGVVYQTPQPTQPQQPPPMAPWPAPPPPPVARRLMQSRQEQPSARNETLPAEIV